LIIKIKKINNYVAIARYHDETNREMLRSRASQQGAYPIFLAEYVIIATNAVVKRARLRGNQPPQQTKGALPSGVESAGFIAYQTSGPIPSQSHQRTGRLGVISLIPCNSYGRRIERYLNGPLRVCGPSVTECSATRESWTYLVPPEAPCAGGMFRLGPSSLCLIPNCALFAFSPSDDRNT